MQEFYIMKKYLLIISLLFISACSSNQASETSAPVPQHIKLYISRSSLYNTEFEQYTLSGDILFHECGKISNGRHQAGRQGVIKLENLTLEDLAQASAEVNESAMRNKEDLNKSGNNSDLFDPGVFQLEMDGLNSEIKTSLDSVTAGTGPLERKLRNLAETIRKSAEEKLCGKEFYGLGL